VPISKHHWVGLDDGEIRLTPLEIMDTRLAIVPQWGYPNGAFRYA
jgi:hypothetical protein